MTTASELAYAELRRQLAEGVYRPGEHLREEEIALRLGVSRTPVREAIRRLGAEGWVRVVPNLGTFVTEWSAGDIEEIFALRSLLEPLAAGWAARKATAADVDHLTALCALGEKAVDGQAVPDLQAVTDANLQFHKAVLRISGQTRTEAIVISLFAMPIILKNFARYDHVHLRRSLSQHRELTEAIAFGDEPWAAAVMRSHVEAGKALFLDPIRARVGNGARAAE
jgi:DNA-binding GntR family transcriptional regulator